MGEPTTEPFPNHLSHQGTSSVSLFHQERWGFDVCFKNKKKIVIFFRLTVIHCITVAEYLAALVIKSVILPAVTTVLSVLDLCLVSFKKVKASFSRRPKRLGWLLDSMTVRYFVTSLSPSLTIAKYNFVFVLVLSDEINLSCLVKASFS